MTAADNKTMDARVPISANAARAFGWGVLNVVAGRLGTMAIGIALARLLGPKEFGTYAVALVALNAVLSFSELGVSLAIVRWREDPRDIVPTVNTISLAASTFLAVLGVACAGLLSKAMGSPSATPVVQVLFLTVVISGLVQSPAALLQRDFQQRQRTLCDQVNLWVGSLLSLLLAIVGTGAMSLAIGRLAGSIAAALLFLRCSPLPYRLGFERSVARKLLRFGLPLSAASILFFIVGFLDQIVVGLVLGPVVLGFYALATNVASWPSSVLSAPLRAVAPAAFSKLRDSPGQLTRAFTSTAGLLAAVAIPVCACLAVSAEPLVAVLYGREWMPAAEILSVLALVAAARIFHEVFYDLLVVLGATASVLLTQFVWAVVLVPTLFVAAHYWGAPGVAVGQLAVMVVVVLPMYLVQVRRHGVGSVRLVRLILPPAVGSVVVAVALSLWTPSIWPPIAAVASAACIGTGLIGALLYPKRTQLLRTLRPSSVST